MKASIDDGNASLGESSSQSSLTNELASAKVNLKRKRGTSDDKFNENLATIVDKSSSTTFAIRRDALNSLVRILKGKSSDFACYFRNDLPPQI
jgi:hypothetical protein